MKQKKMVKCANCKEIEVEAMVTEFGEIPVYCDDCLDGNSMPYEDDEEKA